MTQKTYFASSNVSLTIRYGGSPRHLTFMPSADGGSMVVTADPLMQQALESHPRFGRLFRCIGSVEIGSPEAGAESASRSRTRRQ